MLPQSEHKGHIRFCLRSRRSRGLACKYMSYLGETWGPWGKNGATTVDTRDQVQRNIV
jgi:hypothetical protein